MLAPTNQNFDFKPFKLSLSEVPKVLLLVYVRASELRAIFEGIARVENYVAQKKNTLI